MDFRLDSDQLSKNHNFTREGFLIIKGSPTRVGVFKYYEPDGSIRRELRHPQDVLRADSLKSMGGKPITIASHPLEMLNPDNAKNYQVGTSSNQVTVEYGPLIWTTYNFHRKDAIDAIVAKKYTEISLGYNTNVVRESGVFRGERYDFRQTDIINNHHSVIETGRAGRDCSLRFDSIKELPDYESLAFGARFDGIPVKPQIFDMSPKKDSKPMAKILINSVEMEVDDALAAVIRQDQQTKEAEIQLLTQQNEQLQGANDELISRLDEQLGEFEEHLDSAKKSEMSDEMDDEMDDEDEEDYEEETSPQFVKKGKKAMAKKDSANAIREQIRAELKEEFQVRADAEFLQNHFEVEFKFDEAMGADDMRRHILSVCEPNKKARFDSADAPYLKGVYDMFMDARKDEVGAEFEEFRADEETPQNIVALKAAVTAGRLSGTSEQNKILNNRTDSESTLPAWELQRSQNWRQPQQSA